MPSLITKGALFGVFISSVGSAQSVLTNVTGSGIGSYFYEEHHPTKYDSGNFTLCWGANSKSETDNMNSSASSSTENSGSMTVLTNTRGALSQMINQKLQWSSVFDRQDYIFHVQFKKEKGHDQLLKRESTCSTRKWTYRVDEAKSQVVTSVNVVVPDNVWVVRIRPQLNRNLISLKYTIQKVAEISSSESLPHFKEAPLTLSKDTTYFFVKPKEELKIELSLEDHANDIDLIADFEVTFVGFNRCDKAMQEFKTLQGQDPKSPLSKDLVINGFKSVISTAQSQAPNAVDQLHKSMIFLGCLTSPEYAKDLLYRNNAMEVREVLTGIHEAEQELFLGEDSSKNSAQVGAQNTAFRVLKEMARFSISHSLLQGLKPYCELYPIIDPKRDKVVGQMTGYIFMQTQLDKMGLLLGLDAAGESKKMRVDRYFEGLLAEFAKLEGLTYQEVVLQKLDQVVALAENYEVNAKGRAINQAVELFDRLPAVRPTEDLVNLAVSLDNIQKLIYEANSAVARQFDLMSLRSSNAVDLVNLRKATYELHNELILFEAYFSQVRSLVDGGKLADLFRHNVTSIARDDLATSRTWLTKTYGGFLADFIKSVENRELLQGQGQFDIEGVYQCLLSPVSIN